MSHVCRPLIAAAALNTAVTVGEFIAGSQSGSVSLLADAVHNLSDEVGLVCLALAYLLPVTMSRNLQRSANLLNTVGIVLISGIVAVEAMSRLLQPTAVIGVVPIVAGLAAAAGNAGVALALRGNRHMNPSIRLAYLHNVGDVSVSVGPVVAGVLVSIVGWAGFDALIGLSVAVWLGASTIQEVRASGTELIWPEDAVCKHEPQVPASLARAG